MDPEENGQGLEQNNQQENVENVDQQGNAEVQPQTEPEKSNPYWEKVLNEIPSEFHGRITPTFKEWDDNFSKVQSQYAPYKQLVERNVPYEQIDKSLQLAQLLSTNPELVYQELHNRFGQQSEQGQQENEDEDDDFESDEPQAYDLEKDPRWIAQQEQLQAMQNFFMSQQQAQMDQEIETEIDNEFTALEQQIGRKLDEDERVEVINRSIYLADKEGPNAVPDLAKGYEAYNAFVSKVRNTRPNNTAPDVLSGNGGHAIPPSRLKSTNSEERINYIAEMLKANAQNNQ